MFLLIIRSLWAVVIFAASPCPNPTCVSRSSLSVVEDEKGKLLLLLTRSSALVLTQNYQYCVFLSEKKLGLVSEWGLLGPWWLEPLKGGWGWLGWTLRWAALTS